MTVTVSFQSCFSGQAALVEEVSNPETAEGEVLVTCFATQIRASFV